MITTIFSFLKSVLVSLIISWGKRFLFSKLPDWKNPEEVRQWILKNLQTIAKLAKSTEIKWDDRIIETIQTVINDSVVFDVVYDAIIDENTEPMFTETDKQTTLRERIQKRIGEIRARRLNAMPESEYDGDVDKLISMVNAIKNIKHLAIQ